MVVEEVVVLVGGLSYLRPLRPSVATSYLLGLRGGC